MNDSHNVQDGKSYRWQRIERLFEELRYEITRGMMEGEIEESLGYRFIIGVSKTYPTRGVVDCEFRARPVENMAFLNGPVEPRLKVVK